MLRAHLMIVALALLLVAGCGRKETGPVSTVRAFYGALGEFRDNLAAPLPPPAFDMLDSATRTELETRAKAASELAGRKIEPWELVASYGLASGERIAKIELVSPVSKDGERAEVRVELARIDPDEPGGEVVVPLVREGGEWRIVLPLPAE